jgi:hypothetical protein
MFAAVIVSLAPDERLAKEMLAEPASTTLIIDDERFVFVISTAILS